MKIIRDKLHKVIESDRIKYVPESVGYDLLLEKINEELQELKDSDWKDPGEYADLIEVLYAVAGKNDISEYEINRTRLVKKEERGGFDDYLILL